jgi:predicted O-methyltransferase YrrM
MNFTEALPIIADFLSLDAKELAAYCDEDDMPGKDIVGEQPGYIPFTHDGKLLYALVRILRPRTILESGVDEGGSINHMAAALKKNGIRGGGDITGVDIREDRPGGHIEKWARPFAHIVSQDIKYFVERTDLPRFDFIHEDSSHEVHTVRAVYENLYKLMPHGGVIVSHDLFTGVGTAIKTGIKDSGFEGKPLYICYDESPCGWAIMRYEGVK